MSRNIVFEGWLTKSPPTKRIWRAKWRKRWFALRQSGELPGQYFLDYYADRNYRRLKGTINLDLCEQVDAGLHMKRGNGTLDPKIRGSVFTIRTQSRTYHLEASCEEEMGRWVDTICRVCGLRATEEEAEDGFGTYSPNSGAMNDRENADTTGPYIPISQCITGTKLREDRVPYPLDPKNRLVFERTSKCQLRYNSQPHIHEHNAEFSENESNISDDDCSSLNACHSVMDGWHPAKSFTRLEITPRGAITTIGPPVPPRPPKTFMRPRNNPVCRDTFHAPRPRDPDLPATQPWVQVPMRTPRRHSPVTKQPQPRIIEDDEEIFPQSMTYCNLLTMPPAVNRNLKPRHGHVHNVNVTIDVATPSRSNPDLQYLDLTLHHTPPPKKQLAEVHKPRNVEANHRKSLSADEIQPDYTTVDLMKTEALFVTRQDAEASRSTQI